MALHPFHLLLIKVHFFHDYQYETPIDVMINLLNIESPKGLAMEGKKKKRKKTNLLNIEFTYNFGNGAFQP